MPPYLRVVKEAAVAGEIEAAINAQKGAANGLAELDGSARIPLVRLGGITDDQIAAENKDGAGSVPSLRTLGSGSQQAAAGSHSHGTRDYVSVREHGAVGDGAADDSPAFQVAIDAVFDAGGGEVFVPQGRYRLASGIVVRSNVKLVGVGGLNDITTTRAVGETIPLGAIRTSMLLCASATEPAIVLSGSGPGVKGLAFYYPDQVKPQNLWVASVAKALADRIQPTAAADTKLYECVRAGATGATEPDWSLAPNVGDEIDDPDANGVRWRNIGTQTKTPIAYPPTIALISGPNTCTPSVMECMFVNSYTAVDFSERHNRGTLDKLWIGSYANGIIIDGSVDVNRILDVQMIPWYDLAEGLNYPASLDDWVLQNGRGLVIRRADWAYITNLFIYSKRQCWVLQDSPKTTGIWEKNRTSNGIAHGVSLDRASYGLVCSATNTSGWEVSGLQIYVGPNYPNSSVITATGGSKEPNLRIKGGMFSGVGAHYVEHRAGHIAIEGVDFLEGSKSAQLQHFTTASGWRIADNRFKAASGTAAVVENPDAASPANQRVIIHGNDLGSLAYAHPSALPTGLYRTWDNAGITDYPNRSGGAAVAAGAAFVDVTLSPPQQSTAYRVVAMPTWNTTVWISNRTTTGFRIDFGTAPTASATLYWTLRVG
jgi:hypothetical protein